MGREGNIKLLIFMGFLIFNIIIILLIFINIFSFASYYSVLPFVIMIFIFITIPIVIFITYIKHRNIVSSNGSDLIKSKEPIINKDHSLNELENKILEKENELQKIISKPFISKEVKKEKKKVSKEIRALNKKLGILKKIKLMQEIKKTRKDSSNL